MILHTTMRLEHWIRGRPRWARAPLYGALIVFTLMGVKLLAGAALLLVLSIAFSDSPLRLGLIAIGTAIAALLGGALSGLMYDVVGRSLVRRRGLLADIGSAFTLLPYLLVLAGLIAIADETKRDGLTLLLSVGLCAVLFGSLALKPFLLESAGNETNPSTRSSKVRGR